MCTGCLTAACLGSPTDGGPNGMVREPANGAHMTDNRATNRPQQLTSAELEKVVAGAGSGAGKVAFNPFSIKK